MSQSPQVSVIIPTCGRPQLLLECVGSILRNDFTDFEILVVDQDPEKSLEAEMAKRFNNDPRIVYLFLNQAGASRARNLGIEHARGEIIAFVDDDLEVVPGWLRAYVNAFTVIQPPPGIVGGRVDPLWLSPRPEWLPEEREYLLGLYNKGDKLMPMPEGDLPFTANCAVPRRTIDRVGMLDERIGFSYARKTSLLAGEDSLLSLKVKQANYSIYYQPQAKAWHKISKNKLIPQYFLKRNFWEGVTTVVVLYLSGSATLASCPGFILWHIREIGRQIWHAVFPKNTGGNLTRAKARMRLAAACAYSLGAIYASAKLLWTRRLP
jgi:glycosyltransferase involved in cell wall biosynthesis